MILSLQHNTTHRSSVVGDLSQQKKEHKKGRWQKGFAVSVCVVGEQQHLAAGITLCGVNITTKMGAKAVLSQPLDWPQSPTINGGMGLGVCGVWCGMPPLWMCHHPHPAPCRGSSRWNHARLDLRFLVCQNSSRAKRSRASSQEKKCLTPMQQHRPHRLVCLWTSQHRTVCAGKCGGKENSSCCWPSLEHRMQVKFLPHLGRGERLGSPWCPAAPFCWWLPRGRCVV